MSRKRRTVPTEARDFKRMWPSFEAWLLANGSAVYAPTNEYELARFLTATGTGIVYCNARGSVSHWHGGAHEAMQAFVEGKAWRAVNRRARDKNFVRDYEALVKRDGDTCMYCWCSLTMETATIEHVVPVTSGGCNHLANKALACEPHNQEAGHLSAREKLEMAIRIRSSWVSSTGGGPNSVPVPVEGAR